ncbi:MAG: site-2 protease family protein [bacterium]|nr:site-2 protease family protein [bacterium]
MFLQNLIESPIRLLINAAITLIALTGHELAHAWVSTKLGDPTPRMQGRLTINPLAHLDPVGTILMILTGFGWAKPVGINPMYYKNVKKGTALTAAAGPLANLLMSIIMFVLYALFIIVVYKTGLVNASVISAVQSFVITFAVRNLCFMVFNFIPIPPLDGSKVLGVLIPDRAYYTMLRYERYSMLLIMLLSLSGAFSTIIGTGVNIAVNAIWTPIMHILQMVI